MSKHLVTILAGLASAVAGGLAGLFVLFSLTGLEHPGWSPVAMLAGAGLFSAAVMGMIRSLGAATIAAIAVATSLVGAAIGVGVMQFRDSYDAAIAAGVGLVVAVALLSAHLGPKAEAETREDELV